MKIKTYEDGSARLLWDWRDIALTTADFKALRVFFQAERDEELGRWRDPENPDWITYPSGNEDAVRVFNEREGGTSQYWTRRNVESRDPAYTWYSASYYAADRYFAAHPKPKPWDAAQPDEVWVLTDGDRSEVFRCGENGLYSLKTGDPISRVFPIITVTAGHRIWPEGGDK